MELNEILEIAVKAKSSDIHIKAGLPPIVRIDGRLRPIPNVPRLAPDAVKTMAFAISAFFTGIAGCLYAHKVLFINPESYTIVLSVELLAMVIIGGLGSLHGAVFGAAFFIFLPQLIVMTKDYMPAYLQKQTGMEAALFGLLIVLVMLFEPLGIYGRWLKTKFYFEMFPLYKKDSFRREKKYQKAERH